MVQHQTNYNKIRKFVSSNSPCGMPAWKGNNVSLSQNGIRAINSFIYEVEYDYVHNNVNFNFIEEFVVAQFKKSLNEEKVLKDFNNFPWAQFKNLIREELGWLDRKELDRKEITAVEDDDEYTNADLEAWAVIDEEFSRYN